MGLAQPQQYPVMPNAGQVWNGQFGTETQVTFLNLDPMNTVSLGNIQGFSPAANSIPLSPNSSITLDGKKPWFASGPVGTQNLTVIPGSIQYVPGQATIQSLLPNFAFPIIINNGSFFQTPILSVSSFASYNCIVRPHTPNVLNPGAPFCLNIQFNWYADAGGTVPLFIEQFDIWSGGAGSGQDAYGRGPNGGPFLQITMSGANAASTIVLDQFLFFGNANNISTTEWRQSSIGSGINQAGFLLRSANDSVFENLTASFSLVLPVTSNIIIPFPLLPGEHWLRLATTSPLAQIPLIAHAKGLTNGTIATTNSPGEFWTCPVGGQTDFTPPIAPRIPMYMVLATTATSPTVTFVMNGKARSI